MGAMCNILLVSVCPGYLQCVDGALSSRLVWSRKHIIYVDYTYRNF